MGTRRKEYSEIVLFGPPTDLSKIKLPTNEDVIRFYLYEEKIRTMELKSYKCSQKEITKIVGLAVKDLWDKACILTISTQRIEKLILDLIKKYRNLLKCPKTRIFTEVEINKRESFNYFSKGLLDIAKCKCLESELCECLEKLSENSRVFLHDQRSNRKMIIDQVLRKQREQKKEMLNLNNKLADLTIENDCDLTANFQSSDNSLNLSNYVPVSSIIRISK